MKKTLTAKEVKEAVDQYIDEAERCADQAGEEQYFTHYLYEIMSFDVYSKLMDILNKAIEEDLEV